jgi:lipopolysaccharide biosynthesis glycosyltransferase
MCEAIHVVTSADDKFAIGLAGTFKSALAHLAHDQLIHLYVLDGGVTQANQAALVQHWNDRRLSVDWIRVDRCVVSKFITGDHMSDATYYRLLAPEVLPADLKRFIFLDADLLIRHDLNEMWQVGMDGMPCLAVQDIGAPYIDSAVALAAAPEGRLILVNERPIPNYRKLGLSPTRPYFNGGVMVVDLEMWRREHLGRRMLKVLAENAEHVTYWDQYALNTVLSGRWKALSPLWNQNSYIFRERRWLSTRFCRRECPQYANDPWIVHFNWRKPWEIGGEHPFGAEFLRHLENSPWQVSLDQSIAA